VYFLVRNRNGLVWNTNSNAFEVYATANLALYAVTGTEQSTSAFYAGTFPSQIPPGTYSIIAKAQTGGSPAETDATVGGQNLEWNGTAIGPLSDLATSGQVGAALPMRLARQVAVSGYPLYLKSSADHITPFVSGIVSGQINKDWAGFTALGNGVFTERGLGYYSVNLTSGDLNASTIALLFTANGVSGGSADPLPYSILTQRTSGSP
jgi:hypothetical protein